MNEENNVLEGQNEDTLVNENQESQPVEQSIETPVEQSVEQATEPTVEPQPVTNTAPQMEQSVEPQPVANTAPQMQQPVEPAPMPYTAPVQQRIEPKKSKLGLVLGIIFGVLALFIVLIAIVVIIAINSNPKNKISKGFEKSIEELSKNPISNELGLADLTALSASGNTKTSISVEDTFDLSVDYYRNVDDNNILINVDYDLNSIEFYGDNDYIMGTYSGMDEVLYIDYRDDLYGQIKKSGIYDLLFADVDNDELRLLCDEVVTSMDSAINPLAISDSNTKYNRELAKAWSDLYKRVKVTSVGKQDFEIDGKTENSMVYEVTVLDDDIDEYITKVIAIMYEHEPESLETLALAMNYDLDSEYDYFVDDIMYSIDDVSFKTALDQKGRIIYLAYEGTIDYDDVEFEITFNGGEYLYSNFTGYFYVDGYDEVRCEFTVTDNSEGSNHVSVIEISVEDDYDEYEIALESSIDTSNGKIKFKVLVDDEEYVVSGKYESEKGKRLYLALDDIEYNDGYDLEEMDTTITFEIVEYNNSIEKPVGDQVDLLSMSEDEFYDMMYKILLGDNYNDYDYDWDE